MTRYFFHLRNHVGTSRDEAGVLLPDREAAIRHALQSARLLMGDTASAPSDWSGWSIQVGDEQNRILFTLPFPSVRAVTPQTRHSHPRDASGPAHTG